MFIDLWIKVKRMFSNYKGNTVVMKINQCLGKSFMILCTRGGNEVQVPQKNLIDEGHTGHSLGFVWKYSF